MNNDDARLAFLSPLDEAERDRWMDDWRPFQMRLYSIANII